MQALQAVEIAGKLIEYSSWVRNANRDAPTLIFLHEGLGCVALWRDFPAKLAEATGCHALIYSRHGYGRSDPCELPRPTTYLHHEALDVLPALIETLRIGPHILVGHSDGGSIALIYAGGIRPKNLLGVITEAAHVFNEQAAVDVIRLTRKQYVDGALRVRLAKHHGGNVDFAFWGWCDVWLSAEFWHWNIESYLPTINVPTLVIQGADDHYGTVAQVTAIKDGIGPCAMPLLIPNCAHAPHRERAAHTASIMQPFIDQLTQVKL